MRSIKRIQSLRWINSIKPIKIIKLFKLSKQIKLIPLIKLTNLSQWIKTMLRRLVVARHLLMDPWDPSMSQTRHGSRPWRQCRVECAGSRLAWGIKRRRAREQNLWRLRERGYVKCPYRLVARTSRCGRDNPGSTPGEDTLTIKEPCQSWACRESSLRCKDGSLGLV